MNNISKLEKNLIEFLLINGQTPCKMISQSLNVSDKTIRNEIHKINNASGEVLINSNQNGFYIESDKINKALQLLKNVAQSIDMLLLRHLLLKQKPIDFYEIAEMFFISPSSLQNIIKQLNITIDKYQLKIFRRNSELHIEGTNFSKQQLYADLIHQEAQLAFKDLEDFSDYFPHINIENLTNKIKEIIKLNNCIIPPYYEKNLLINIFITVNLFDESIQSIDSQIISNTELKIASEIVNNLNNSSKNNTNLINMIGCCLNGIIKENQNDLATQKPYSEEFELKLNKCLNNAFSHFGISVENNNLLKFFPDHIFNLIQRLRNGNYCYFPDSNNLKDNCIYIYDIAVYLCQLFNTEFNIQVPENEISLIAIHLGFIIEESLKTSEKLTIVLYSNNHPLIDNFIFKNIKERHNDIANIIVVNNLYQLSTFKSTDFIVSTVNLNNIIDKKQFF